MRGDREVVPVMGGESMKHLFSDPHLAATGRRCRRGRRWVVRSRRRWPRGGGAAAGGFPQRGGSRRRPAGVCPPPPAVALAPRRGGLRRSGEAPVTAAAWPGREGSAQASGGCRSFRHPVRTLIFWERLLLPRRPVSHQGQPLSSGRRVASPSPGWLLGVVFLSSSPELVQGGPEESGGEGARGILLICKRWPLSKLYLLQVYREKHRTAGKLISYKNVRLGVGGTLKRKSGCGLGKVCGFRDAFLLEQPNEFT